MEAVLAALFLDGGLEPVRVFVRRRVMGETEEQLAEELRSGAALGNLQIRAAGAFAGGRAGRPGLPGQERKRPRPP